MSSWSCDGESRYLENPAERVEDVRSPVDYLITLAVPAGRAAA
ncbi:hypothetical protein ACSYGO_46400 [Streptomyces krungchingensis]